MDEIVYVIPLFMQAVAILFDEFYFHHKRGLPLWEKIGHPLDSLSFILAIGYLNFAQNFYLPWYVGLCTFSTILITKDEWVHHDLTEPEENWLHSLLFILHPTVFYCCYILRFEFNNVFILHNLFALLIFFVVYQCGYWLRQRSLISES